MDAIPASHSRERQRDATLRGVAQAAPLLYDATMGLRLLTLTVLIACPSSGPAEAPTTGSSTADSGPVDTALVSDPHLGTHSTPDLPQHDDCLPEGQVMDDATCLAVVEHDGRFPGQSFDRSGVDPDPNDPRVGSEQLQWLTDEVRRCTCACCHQSSLGGPGAYFWDLDYEGEVWLDSASDWSLEVFAGIRESENQHFLSSDPARVLQIIEAELERRDR